MWYQWISQGSPWNITLQLKQLSIKRQKFQPFFDFINIIKSSAVMSVILLIYRNKWYVYFVWVFFPFAQWKQWTNSQNTSAALPRILFAKTDRGLIVVFKSFLAFSHSKFPCSCTDIISYQVRAIMLKPRASFFIWYPNIDCYFSWLMIQLLCKLHGELFGMKRQSASENLHDALCTFTVAGISHIKCLSRFVLCTLYLSA